MHLDAGAPASWALYDKGLSTAIGWQDRDASGRRLSPEARAQLYRLRKWHQRTKVSESIERNLAQALREMTRIDGELNLPRTTTETAAMISPQDGAYHRLKLTSISVFPPVRCQGSLHQYIGCPLIHLYRIIANTSMIMTMKTIRMVSKVCTLFQAPFLVPNEFISKSRTVSL